MPKELPSSRDEREQRSDALTNKGAHSQGKVHDFAVRSQTYRYTKDDYFTLRSGERVPRLRGGSEFDDYDNSGGYGGYGDSYNLGTYGSYGRDGGHGGWYGDDEGYRGSYDRGWRGDDEEYRGSYDRIGHRDDEEYRGSYDRGRYGDDGNPSDQWKEHLASTSDKSAWEREQQTKGQDEWLKDERERAREAEEWSKFREENRRDKEAFEPIKQEILELIRQWEMKDEEARQHDGDVHDDGQGDGNGGGDGGNYVAHDGYDNSSDGAPNDLSAVRAAYPELDEKLLLIEEKLNVEGHADTFQIIESVSQEERIVGFDDWVAESAGRDAERMLDKVMELAAARYVLQEYIDDPNVIVRIGQDAHSKDPSFDITVEHLLPNGDAKILRQIEVYTPANGFKDGDELISAIAHAASKIPQGVRDGSELLPPGTLEAIVAVDPWPPESIRKGGIIMKFDTHGEYTRHSVTNPTVTYGSSVSLLKSTVGLLNRRSEEYENPVEFVERLTVIDRNGQALFEVTNTTPGVHPTQWTWRDLQG